MAETKYESKVESIPASAAEVYSVLSNLSNLERVRDLIPQDKVQELEITEDYIRMKVDGFTPYQFNQVKGQPFVVSELVSAFEEIINN